jgi:hypothetical protein
MPSGLKIRSSPKSRSDLPETRFTITAESV